MKKGHKPSESGAVRQDSSKKEILSDRGIRIGLPENNLQLYKDMFEHAPVGIIQSTQ